MISDISIVYTWNTNGIIDIQTYIFDVETKGRVLALENRRVLIRIDIVGTLMTYTWSTNGILYIQTYDMTAINNVINNKLNALEGRRVVVNALQIGDTFQLTFNDGTTAVYNPLTEITTIPTRLTGAETRLTALELNRRVISIVSNGITTTITWNDGIVQIFNIKGDKGDRGDIGPQGNIGERGPPGESGLIAGLFSGAISSGVSSGAGYIAIQQQIATQSVITTAEITSANGIQSAITTSEIATAGTVQTGLTTSAIAAAFTAYYLEIGVTVLVLAGVISNIVSQISKQTPANPNTKPNPDNNKNANKPSNTNNTNAKLKYVFDNPATSSNELYESAGDILIQAQNILDKLGYAPSIYLNGVKISNGLTVSGDLVLSQNNINKIIIRSDFITLGKYANIETTIDSKMNNNVFTSNQIQLLNSITAQYSEYINNIMNNQRYNLENTEANIYEISTVDNNKNIKLNYKYNNQICLNSEWPYESAGDILIQSQDFDIGYGCSILLNGAKINNYIKESGDMIVKQNNLEKIIISSDYIKIGKYANIETTIDSKANTSVLSSYQLNSNNVNMSLYELKSDLNLTLNSNYYTSQQVLTILNASLTNYTNTTLKNTALALKLNISDIESYNYIIYYKFNFKYNIIKLFYISSKRFIISTFNEYGIIRNNK